MTWVIIITTILSAVTGGGVVYASGDALPGDALYPVKTWVEGVQLSIGSDVKDADLYMDLIQNRVQEMVELKEQGRFDDLDEAVHGYENQTEAMTRLMAGVQAEDPEEALRLRTELEQKLQEQAHLMEALLAEETSADSDQLREQLQAMLQTNTQTRLRINEEDEDENVIPDATEESTGDETSELTEEPEEETSGNGEQTRFQELVNASGDTKNAHFTFMVSNAAQNGVYAEVDGVQYDCSVDGDLVTCDIPDAPATGTICLYNLKDHSLLYSHDYDYDWLDEKEAGSDNGGNQVQGDSSGGSHDSGSGGGGGNGKK